MDEFGDEFIWGRPTPEEIKEKPDWSPPLGDYGFTRGLYSSIYKEYEKKTTGIVNLCCDLTECLQKGVDFYETDVEKLKVHVDILAQIPLEESELRKKCVSCIIWSLATVLNLSPTNDVRNYCLDKLQSLCDEYGVEIHPENGNTLSSWLKDFKVRIKS